MSKNFNKGIVYAFTSLFFGLIITVGCNKSFTESNTIINAPTTIHTSTDKIDIRASDVITTGQFFKRKIELVDRSNNTVRDTYIITVQSSDGNSDIHTAIKKGTFTGYMTIESDNIIYLKKESIDGHVVESSSVNSTMPRYSVNFESMDLPNTCKLSLISNCVSKKINDMSFVAYLACLYGAPECYGGLWADCTFIFCVTGEQNRSTI